MSLLDALSEFDAALDWQVDDPLLADEPSLADAGDSWSPAPRPLPPAAGAT